MQKNPVRPRNWKLTQLKLDAYESKVIKKKNHMLSTSLTTFERTLFLAYPKYFQKTITLLHSNS